MHPGVIGSGLESLFRGAESPERQSQAGDASTASPSSSTPQSPSTLTLNSTGESLSPVSSYSTSTTSQPPKRQDTLFTPPNPDPTFNPRFNNDVNLPIRKGWESAMHFL